MSPRILLCKLDGTPSRTRAWRAPLPFSAVHRPYLPNTDEAARVSVLLRGAKFVAKVLPELLQLRINRVFAQHEADGLHNQELAVAVEFDRVAQASPFEGAHDLPSAFERPDLLEKLLARIFRECDRSADRLDKWHWPEAIE